jgi:drug/metabolite transporter (DMT)-like permease
MMIATLYMLPLSLLVDRPFSLPMPSLASLASMLALGVFGTALAFTVYYRLLERASASYVSMTTYMIPVFGVILGAIVLDEAITWERAAGCGSDSPGGDDCQRPVQHNPDGTKKNGRTTNSPLHLQRLRIG